MLKPIPTATIDSEFEAYVQRIIAAWHAAPIGGRSRGRSWYQTAHQLAEMISDGDARQGAGVIAALSANTGWQRNCQLATQALATGTARGHFGDALRKAQAIIDGQDPETVLPMDSKTGHFFRCIADPSDADAVVIDRHAHDIAAGVVYGSADRGLSNKTRYALLAHAYREAARRLGELPSTVQAVTWVAHVEREA